MSLSHELSISRQIQAPSEIVWQAWADAERFAKWWLPEPMVCQVKTMDMVAGGGFETLMSEDGLSFQPHMQGCFLAIDPQERIVMTTALTEGWLPAEPWLSLTSIITLSEDESGTLYHARALHKNAEEARKHEDMGFHEGWGLVLSQLAKLCETA